jgi:ABC-type phosphate transport system permease subunit
MAVYMVIGGASVPPITLNPAVSSNIITRVIATQYSEVAWGSAHWEALFGLGIILFIIVATLNAIVTRVVRRGAAR